MNHCNFTLIHIHVLIVAVLRFSAPGAGEKTPRGNCDTVTALIERTDPRTKRWWPDSFQLLGNLTQSCIQCQTCLHCNIAVWTSYDIKLCSVNHPNVALLLGVVSFSAPFNSCEMMIHNYSVIKTWYNDILTVGYLWRCSNMDFVTASTAQGSPAVLLSLRMLLTKTNKFSVIKI